MNRGAPTLATLLLAFAEGGALLAYQLVSAKLLAPWFGTSLAVWSSVLGLTLAGLAVGYGWGAALARNSETAPRTIFLHMLVASAFLISLPWWQSAIQSAVSLTEMTIGLLLAALVLISPLMMLLGTFSPLGIAVLERFGYPTHRAAGVLFGTSTIGGVAYALVVGLVVAPTYGLKASCYGLGGILLAAAMIFARCTRHQPSTR